MAQIPTAHNTSVKYDVLYLHMLAFVSYWSLLGVNYTLLEGQLVLSYVYISNPVQLLKVKCQGQLY